MRLLSLFGVLAILSGCATWTPVQEMPESSYVPKAATLCDTARVLEADLSLAPEQRRYRLPGGDWCARLVPALSPAPMLVDLEFYRGGDR